MVANCTVLYRFSGGGQLIIKELFIGGRLNQRDMCSGIWNNNPLKIRIILIEILLCWYVVVLPLYSGNIKAILLCCNKPLLEFASWVEVERDCLFTLVTRNQGGWTRPCWSAYKRVGWLHPGPVGELIAGSELSYPVPVLDSTRKFCYGPGP